MPVQYSLDVHKAQAAQLREVLCRLSSFSAAEREYADYCFEGDDVVVAYYPKKGRLLVQGKGADDLWAGC